MPVGDLLERVGLGVRPPGHEPNGLLAPRIRGALGVLDVTRLLDPDIPTQVSVAFTVTRVWKKSEKKTFCSAQLRNYSVSEK